MMALRHGGIAYNPSTGKAKARGLQVPGQPEPQIKTLHGDRLSKERQRTSLYSTLGSNSRRIYKDCTSTCN